MKSRLRQPGDEVTIYHDPHTRTQSEGQATLIRLAYSTNVAESWYVTFHDEKFSGTYLRLIANMPLPPTIKYERILEAVRCNDYTGFCLSCGAEFSPCEPDARKYHCPQCQEDNVYGAEEVLLMITY